MLILTDTSIDMNSSFLSVLRKFVDTAGAFMLKKKRGPSVRNESNMYFLNEEISLQDFSKTGFASPILQAVKVRRTFVSVHVINLIHKDGDQ